MRKVLSVVLILLFSVGCLSSEVSACLYDFDKTREEKAKDVRYWYQGDYSEYIPNTSSTLASSGCNSFACAYALIKMGFISPANGDSILTFTNKAKETSEKTGIPAYEDGFYFNYDGIINKMYPDVTYVEGSPDGNHKTSLANSSNEEEYIKDIKALMKKGYYVIGCVMGPVTSGHCIFFDCVGKDENGNEVLYIGDSAYGGLTWESIYGGKGHVITYLEVLECKNKPSYNQPSIYEDIEPADINSTVDADKVLSNSQDIYQSLIAEKNLTGMPSEQLLWLNQKKPLNFTYSDLSLDEQSALSSIKEQKDLEGSFSLYSVVNICLNVIGFVLIIYSILLLLALMFDRVNGILTFSMVSVLTLGKVRVADSDDIIDMNGEGKEYSSTKAIVGRCILLMLLGGMLISGVIVKWVISIIGSIIK